jgi:DNA invertase Pin-like site-specific DNA recombinase
MSAPNKIRATHLERTAIIYVRQSSPAQVRDNRESQARQYALAEEAARLGWPASKIAVIDADQGISGRFADRRGGFRELVSRVCLGEVGAVFGLEIARLARSNADFARLLELARLTDTLVIDTDGMYDLREFNDRAAAESAPQPNVVNCALRCRSPTCAMPTAAPSLIRIRR